MTATNIDNMPNNSFSGVAHTQRHVRSRTTSVSSDRPSTIGGHSLMSPPLSVSPEAAFIAAPAASQIVMNDHDSHSEIWYDQVGLEPSGETALVSFGALQLANNFIDQILFNIIAVARSTRLSTLRPAVCEVLKPKLAKDAINQADEELREYLGGGEVEDLSQSPKIQSPRDWDLELVWKRTRLRCMVYSSLGDMEEEDEDYFMEQEHLCGESEDIMSEVVSPAVAIFLTSILEFMGEQVLVVSGQAAFNRLRVRYEKELKDGARSPGAISERIVVEELDMERVALDRTLGRLWRSWKKRIRSPVEPSYPSRPFPRSTTHSRHGSSAGDVVPTLSSPLEELRNPEGAKPERSEEPAKEEDSEEEVEEGTIAMRPQPNILMLLSSGTKPSPNLTQSPTPTQPSRRRANSLPTPGASPYTSPIEAARKAPGESKPLADEQEASEKVSDQAATESISSPESVREKEDESSVSSIATKPEGGIGTKVAVSSIRPVSKIAGAAVGTAAVSGVAAIVQGSAVKTKVSPWLTPMEEDEIDDFTEEPEIMTSSRVSVGGRSSPSASESGGRPRPPSIIVPVRSNSLQSVRVIDVQSRSPVVRSRNDSIDVPDYISATRSNMSLSREGSISTPPIVEEADNETAFAKAIMKSAVMASSRGSSRESSPASRQASIPGNSRKLAGPTSAPTTRPALGPSQVTILNQPMSSDNLDIDPKPDVPQKSPANLRQQVSPVLPERNASRGVYGQSKTMGVPSVDRSQTAPRGSSESPKSGRAAHNESPSSSTSNKFKAVRNSEDSSSHRSEDVARNFEELLQNDQTLQYTLTPENMRDMDWVRSLNTGSPAMPPAARKSQDAKHVELSRSSSLKRSVSVTKATGLNSHPPTDLQFCRKLAGSVPRVPPVSMSPKARSGAVQARDARIPRESMQDFADFIRSTGPSGDRSGAPSASHARNISVPVQTKTSMDYRQPGSVNRARLMARDAAVSSSNESSYLIDFIRRGPPSSSNNPRIPRNVAPFRTTMDSDQFQMSGAVGGKAVDVAIPDVRVSQASTNATETSVQSSINSESALLSQANGPAQYSSNFDEEDMIPKRKQRRVRNPYDIDFSDEDDDLFDEHPKPKPMPKEEESLIDFLNNYQPPPEPAPRQPFVTSQAMPKKKASAPNLIARLRSAGGSVSSSNRNGFNVTESRSLSSRASNQSHVPLNVSIPHGAEKYNNMMSGPFRAHPSGDRVVMKKFEPRDAVPATTGRTNDLANFLRDSEPQPSPVSKLASPSEERGSGFSRMFERRRKGSTAF